MGSQSGEGWLKGRGRSLNNLFPTDRLQSTNNVWGWETCSSTNVLKGTLLELFHFSIQCICATTAPIRQIRMNLNHAKLLQRIQEDILNAELELSRKASLDFSIS